MSKRFGRNQKRHAREELLAAKNELLDANMRAKQQTDRAYKLGSDLTRLCDDIRKICPNSVLLDPAEQKMMGYMPDQLSIACYPEMRFNARWEQNVPTLEYQMPDRVDIYKLECFLREHKEDLEKAIHIRYRGTGGEVAYMISREALAYAPRTVVKRMVEDVVEELVHKLSEDCHTAVATGRTSATTHNKSNVPKYQKQFTSELKGK